MNLGDKPKLCIRRRHLMQIASLLLLTAAIPLQAARILVVGDSWGVAAGPALQAALIKNGSKETVNSIAVGGETAENLNTPEGLQKITAALEDNEDATHVHLSIGGNDFLELFQGCIPVNIVVLLWWYPLLKIQLITTALLFMIYAITQMH